MHGGGQNVLGDVAKVAARDPRFELAYGNSLPVVRAA